MFIHQRLLKNNYIKFYFMGIRTPNGKTEEEND